MGFRIAVSNPASVSGEQRRVGDRAGEDADRIERRRLPEDPDRGISPKPAEADDPAEGSRRMTEPFVCVPVASGTMPAPTAAAEPEDEPAGRVRRGDAVAGLAGMVRRQLGRRPSCP